MSSPSSLPSLPPWVKKRPPAAAAATEEREGAAQEEKDFELEVLNDHDDDADADDDDQDGHDVDGKPRRKKKQTKTVDGIGDATSQKIQRMNKKRPRRQGTSPSRQQRPPPPTAPPTVLVQLLQSDHTVLKYFQSLQANLQADVQVWKDRAAALEKDKKRLERQVKKLQKEEPQLHQQNGNKDSTRRVAIKKKSPPPPHPVDKKRLNDTASSPSAPAVEEQGVPIEDNMFDFDDDDDDDSDDSDNDGKPPQAALPTSKRKVTHHDNTTMNKRAGLLFEFEEDDSSSNDDDVENDDRATSSTKRYKGEKRRLSDDDHDDCFQQHEELLDENNEKEQVLQLLTEAYNILERLGVCMVDVAVGAVAVDQHVGVGGGDDNMDVTPLPESQNATVPADTGTTTAAIDRDDDDEKQQQQDEVAAASSIQQQPQHPTPAPRAPRVVVHSISPRANEQVAADLLFVLKSLSRIQLLDSELMQAYPPFETTSLLPACNNDHRHQDDNIGNSASGSTTGGGANTLMTNPLNDREQRQEQQQQDRPPHPLKEGKLLVFRALLILDTYCSPDMSDDNWDSYFAIMANEKNDVNGNTTRTRNNSKMEEMRIGLRGRKQFVQQLVDSLHGEIAHFWAMQDRSLRLATTALHFDHRRVDVVMNNRCSDDDKECDIEENGHQHVEDRTKNKNILGGIKSQARLSSLLERLCLCQLVVGFYLSRNDPQAAADLIRSYLLSTAPSVLTSNDSVKTEDYPKLPPVQSLVLLEAMLLPDAQMLWWLPASERDNANDELSSVLDLVASLVVGDINESNNPCTDTPASTVGPSAQSASSATGIALCIHASAAVWKQRLASCDDRILDLSRVELAAYGRLLESKQVIRLGLGKCTWCASRLQQELVDYYQVFSTEKGRIEKEANIGAPGKFGHQLCLILENSLSSCAPPTSCFHRTDLDMVAFRRVLLSWSLSRRQLFIRGLDIYRAKIGATIVAVNSSNINDPAIGCRFMYDHIYAKPVNEESEQLWLLLSATLECCAMLADGDMAFRCSWRLMDLLNRHQSVLGAAQRMAIFDLFRVVGQMPLIRVINLERRKDRMRSFLCQCMAQEILVVQAVTDLSELPNCATTENDSDAMPGDGYYFGRHAVDGTGRMVEAHGRLVQAVGVSKLNTLVGAEWCPNDLKAFDRDAPNDERMVRMTCSERACALSHIASWKGVLRSLPLPPMDMSSTALLERRDRATNKMLLSYPHRLRRVFRISGFASGQAMHAQNNGMHPVPVCVILEDDAILADRFVDRLQTLLEELPRDFHFCSLGYSRPKTAPIVPYTRNQRKHKSPCILGVPTNLFYLTGKHFHPRNIICFLCSKIFPHTLPLLPIHININIIYYIYIHLQVTFSAKRVPSISCRISLWWVPWIAGLA
jgi:hypothetical protein